MKLRSHGLPLPRRETWQPDFSSALSRDVGAALRRGKQAGQGRRERAYPEGTCATENAS